jgi:hypothetical protein
MTRQIDNDTAYIARSTFRSPSGKYHLPLVPGRLRELDSEYLRGGLVWIEARCYVCCTESYDSCCYG